MPYLIGNRREPLYKSKIILTMCGRIQHGGRGQGKLGNVRDKNYSGNQGNVGKFQSWSGENTM